LQQATTLGVLTISPPPDLHSKILSLAWSREIGVLVAANASLLAATNIRRRVIARAMPDRPVDLFREVLEGRNLGLVMIISLAPGLSESP
jgi:hypothetical protein